MPLTDDTVRRMARLARLRPSEAEAAQLLRDLNAILDFFAQLDAADTDGVAPLSHPRDDRQWLRDDAVTEEDRRDDFQSLAPDMRDGLYRVPPVLDAE